MINTKCGTFELLKNNKEVFDKNVFEEKYIEEIYDKYDYILGDISGSILRLTGFTKEESGEKSYNLIPDFLIESCAFQCGYYILKRNGKGNNNEEV
ncbi:MAG: YutD-like domain-containing protein [bacterium]